MTIPDRLIPNSPEWADAWAELARDPLNSDLPDPTVARDIESGETWRYRGPVAGGHEFRHNCHPTTAAAVVIVVKSNP